MPYISWTRSLETKGELKPHHDQSISISSWVTEILNEADDDSVLWHLTFSASNDML